MGKSFYFLEDPDHAASAVLEWFRCQGGRPQETTTEFGVVLYYPAFGPLQRTETGEINADASPLVTLVLPTRRRGILWTVGEVHFRPKNVRSVSPRLNSIQAKFQTWLEAQELVFENRPGAENAFAYYLEGGSQNQSPLIFALPNALAALRRGQYFVADRDNGSVLDRVCQTLRLRGVECSLAP